MPLSTCTQTPNPPPAAAHLPHAYPAAFCATPANRTPPPPPKITVPPPPEDSRFFFIGVGVSVYNKEMLDKNRLPLVNGFSQLVVSKDDEELETDGATGGDASGCRHGNRPRQPLPAPGPLDTPGAGVGVAAAAGGGQQQQGSAVPATLSQRSGASTGGQDGVAGGGSNRDQMEALVAYAVGRVRKQVEITKQVAEELTKLTPGKLREAAVVQANKVQEMPTLLLDTSKRMVGSGTKLVRKYLDEQERRK